MEYVGLRLRFDVVLRLMHNNKTMKRLLIILPLLTVLALHAEEAGVHRFANYNIRVSFR